MFKKIHSNRDPEATIYSELRKEFGGHFENMETKAVSFLRAYPRPIFLFMLVMIIGSFILSFTVFREKKPGSVLPVKLNSANQALKSSTPGFDQILQAGAALKETIALKAEVENILSKKELGAEDSLKLAQALDRLEHLKKSIQ